MKKFVMWGIVVVVALGIIGNFIPEAPEREIAVVASEQKKPVKVVKNTPHEKKEEEPRTIKEQVQHAVYEEFNDQNGPDGDTLKYYKYTEADKHLDVGIYTDMALFSPREETLSRMMDSLEQLKDIIGVDSVYIQLYYPMTNDYGETFYSEVVTADFSKETLNRIQFDSFNTDSLPRVADMYKESPSLSE